MLHLKRPMLLSLLFVVANGHKLKALNVCIARTVTVTASEIAAAATRSRSMLLIMHSQLSVSDGIKLTSRSINSSKSV